MVTKKRLLPWLRTKIIDIKKKYPAQITKPIEMNNV